MGVGSATIAGVVLPMSGSGHARRPPFKLGSALMIRGKYCSFYCILGVLRRCFVFAPRKSIIATVALKVNESKKSD